MKLPVQLIESFDDIQLNFEAIEGPDTYTDAVLLNSFVANTTPGYYLDGLNFVHLRGSVKTGTSTHVAFVLPAGFRPGVTDAYPALQSSGTAGASVKIDTSGNVSPTYTQTDVWFTGITFLAEN